MRILEKVILNNKKYQVSFFDEPMTWEHPGGIEDLLIVDENNFEISESLSEFEIDQIIKQARSKADQKQKFCMTEEEYNAHNEKYNGICFNCGEIRWGDTEPDARDYPCEEGCEKNAVYGIQEAILMGKIRIVDW